MHGKQWGGGRQLEVERVFFFLHVSVMLLFFYTCQKSNKIPSIPEAVLHVGWIYILRTGHSNKLCECSALCGTLYINSKNTAVSLIFIHVFFMNCVSYPVSGHNNGPGQPPQLHGCPTLQNTHRHIITYSFHTHAPAHCSSLIQSLLHLLLLCHSYPCQRFARSSRAPLLFLFQPACNRPNTHVRRLVQWICMFDLRKAFCKPSWCDWSGL